MPFELVQTAVDASDPLAVERALLAQAALGGCVAQVWQAPRALVVPRSYQRHAALERVRTDFAQRGCPVFLRLSGGGLVPQGPGIVNLSLAYPVAGTLGQLAQPIYQHLCGILADALGTLGLPTHCQAVEGSFCDGRFNLAFGPPGQARKIAGTAQHWHRLKTDSAAQATHAVLAHALLLVSADTDAITASANAFEAAVGSDRHYRPECTISVSQALASMGMAVDDGLDARVHSALCASVAAAPLVQSLAPGDA